MDSFDVTGGSDFGAWAARIGEKLIDATIDAEVKMPNDIERLKIERLGATGYYTEGQTAESNSIAGVPTSALLLIGGALLVFVLLKG